MWLLVMFDLPVTTAAERRRARRFHNNLLDEGFTMKQFSVYLRYFDSRPKPRQRLIGWRGKCRWKGRFPFSS